MELGPIQDGPAVNNSDLQSFMGERNLTPEQMHARLEQAKSKATGEHWKRLEVVYDIHPEKQPSGKQAKMRCQDCGKQMSGSNPNRMAKEYFLQGLCRRASMVSSSMLVCMLDSMLLFLLH
jgi:hypothetical protein